MLFVLHAYDFTDEEALQRRLSVRSEHFEKARELKASGHFILGGALLGSEDQMIGSLMLLDFATEADLTSWLVTDPYVIGRVWEKIDVKPFKQATI